MRTCQENKDERRMGGRQQMGRRQAAVVTGTGEAVLQERVI